MPHALWPYESDISLKPGGLVSDDTFTRASGITPHTEYRGTGDGRSIVRWATEKLGIPAYTLIWSLCPGYYDENGVALHQWDGTPDPILKLFAAIERGEDVAAESGTGTGKSFAMAIATLWFLACYKDAEVYTFAPKEDQLKLYIWKNIQELWPRFQGWFPTAELTALTIRMYGGITEKWSAHGFPVQVAAGEKVSVKASGMHAEHMMLIYEELTGIDPAVTEAGKNTCTAPHNFRVGVGNPTHQLDALHQMAEEPGVTALRISAQDHPNVVTGNASLVPGAVSRTSIAKRLADYGETDPIYLARVRGFSPEQASNALIRLEWLRASAERYNARIQGGWEHDGTVTGKGVDAANSEHGDEGAIADFNENVLVRCIAFPCPNANALGSQVVRECRRDGTEPEHVAIDAIGVGAGCLNEAHRLEFYAMSFQASAKPMPMVQRTLDGELVEWTSDVNKFKNLRAQSYWQLREDLRLNVIDLPHDPELWEELTAITFKDEDVTKLDAKDVVRKLLGRSPNKGDAVAMGNWVRSRARELSGPADERQGISLGYDYKKQRPRERETGEQLFAKILSNAQGDPLANRYNTPIMDF